jgi:S-phase kinase-associated protein 1
MSDQESYKRKRETMEGEEMDMDIVKDEEHMESNDHQTSDAKISQPPVMISLLCRKFDIPELPKFFKPETVIKEEKMEECQKEECQKEECEEEECEKEEEEEEEVETEVYMMEKNLAEWCGTIRHMLEDFENIENQSFPIKAVSISAIIKIHEFLKHHYTAVPYNTELEESYSEKTSMEDRTEWDIEFITKFSKKELMQLTLAANFLNTAWLLRVCTMTIASQITGKTTEEMREYFGVENDFTEEEEEDVKKKNAWMLEH